MVESVLVPVDGSPLSARALSFVSREFPDASVHLLYVVDHVKASYDFDWTSLPGYWDDSPGEATNRGKDVLADARETAENANLTVVAEELAVGRPSSSIVTYATEESVDHVVMGSHGREGLSRFVLGSVAEQVLRRSTVPVTIVR
ncbi:universal stress protein [Halorhabdus amylolytica]|uniref:universal stress protein n=1 Tax=Halorhabdus amylolytica TaxID=2559573 RepID=UPI0010AB1EE1|nr:universal stress protein [Halorhabdus amylolytica]